MRAGNPLRRAVLQLAAAHADDRRWVLEQLPAASRAAIEPLLTEVRALGIDDFQPWLHALDARAHPPATRGANTASTNAWQFPAQNTSDTHHPLQGEVRSPNASQWARWVLSQPESSTLSFDERFTLESLSTRAANAPATIAKCNARLPPAWRGLLIDALTDTPP